MSNYSIAAKKRWASVSPKEKSERMSKLATIRHAKLTSEERTKNALKLVKIRKDNIRRNKLNLKNRCLI